MNSGTYCCAVSQGNAAEGDARSSLASVTEIVDMFARWVKHFNKIYRLSNLLALVELLGLRSELSRMRVVHVAGTKGKGSTAWYISKFLEKAHGKRVGLFTSPHLTDVRERFLINNEKIPEELFCRYFFTVLSLIHEKTHDASTSSHDLSMNLGLFSFFFILFLYVCREEKVDIAVIEAGIGGLNDTTNIIHSEVSVITALGYDHMNVLGNSVTLIAANKAGIIKAENKVCFSFAQNDHPETRAVLEAQARTCGVPIVFHDMSRFPLASSWPCRLGMDGAHMRENSMVGLHVARYMALSPPLAELCGEGDSAYLSSPLTPTELSILCQEGYPGRSQFLEWRRVVAPSTCSCEDVEHTFSTGGSRASPVEEEGKEHVVSNEEEDGSERKARAAPPTMMNQEEKIQREPCSLSRVFFYLDGAHTAESMQHGTKWFIEESALREREEERRRRVGSSTEVVERKEKDTLSNTSVMEEEGGKRLETRRGAAEWTPGSASVAHASTPSTEALMNAPYRILCFYTSRDPESLLGAIAAYVPLFQKVVFMQLFSPKKLKDSPEPGDVEQWKVFAAKIMQETKSTWETLYPSGCPCVGIPHPLVHLEELLPFLQPTTASWNVHTAPTIRSHTGAAAGSTEIPSDSVVPHVFVTGSLFLLGNVLEAIEAYELEHATRKE